MGWFWRASEPKYKPLSDDQKAECRRKCRAFVTGLDGCRRANKDQPSACKHLELRLVACYAEQRAVEEADEHRRCYTKLYKTGARPIASWVLMLCVAMLSMTGRMAWPHAAVDVSSSLAAAAHTCMIRSCSSTCFNPRARQQQGACRALRHACLQHGTENTACMLPVAAVQVCTRDVGTVCSRSKT